jgi:CRISPR-associated protein Cmr4
MYKNAKPLFLICETPLHAGSGSDLGVIDLPIQRERHTSFPKVESSSLKGALREHLESCADTEQKFIDIHRTFGYDDAYEKVKTDNKEQNEIYEKSKKYFGDRKEFSGCLAFSDTRLLLFPVKSMKGVFAWITCKRVLEKFEADMKLTNESFSINGLSDIKENETYHLKGSSLLVGTSKVILEEYTFNSTETTLDLTWFSNNLFNTDWNYWKNKAKTDIVILPNDEFKDFVNLSTEVITRTKIDNATGTVARGALFTEEYLPSESVLYSLVFASNEFTKEKDAQGNPIKKMEAKEAMDFFAKIIEKKNVFQLGGNATLGKGIIRTKFLNDKQNGK